LGDDLAQLAARSETLTGAERVNAAADVVRKRFDLPSIAAATVGRSTYEGWTQEQRETYFDAFIRYTLASQTGALTRYEQEKLAIQAVEEAPGGMAMVRTTYTPDGSDPSTVDFMLEKGDGGEFLIVDLVVDGAISQLKLKRAEFSSVLRSKGYDGLIKILREKADQLLAKRS
jgi:ABC-type transporter MlaC component